MEEVAKKKSTFWPKCYGWSKQIFYIFSWIIIITFINSDDFNAGLFALFLLSIMLSLVLYSISIVQVFLPGKTFKLLDNINENESIHEIMKKLFKEKPMINIGCSCYHLETRTYTSTDAQGNTTTTTTTVAVTTYVEHQQLNIFSYIDISGIFRLKETNKSFIQLELGKEINFNDELTMLDAENIRNELYLKNKHRDAFISVNITKVIPSLNKKYFLVKLRKNKNYFLLQKWVYILSVVLMVDQFYKTYLECISTHQFFVIRKIVSSRQNVLENNKYSKFTPGYILDNENFVANRDEIGGINVETKLILPTEEEIQKSKAYYKFIPEYKLNEYGEVVNNNRNSIDNILNIEKKNENESVEITKIDSSNQFLLNDDNKNNQFDNNN